jgi:hypothetical protein
MRFGFELPTTSLISLFLLSFWIVASAVTNAETATITCQQLTALGWTDCEKTEWNLRRIAGPYKDTSDVSPNSPGDWTRIESQKNRFMATPAAHRWDGVTGCPGDSFNMSRVFGTWMHDAALYYFLTGDAAVRNAVRDELLAQASNPGTNFENTTLWCTNGTSQLDVPNWMMKLLVSYDFIRNDISTENRATLDTWFTAFGNYLEGQVHAQARIRWPNRKNDNYSSSPMPLGSDVGPVYYGGIMLRQWHTAWLNKTAAMTRLFGSIGIVTNNTALKTEAKRFFKEHMRYNICYTNCGGIVTHVEYFRWKNSFPTLGYHYAASSLTSLGWLAERFARLGDYELLDYSTSDGFGGTEGGPKTLQAAVQTHLDIARHAIIRCGRATASECNNVNARIDYHYPGDSTTGWTTGQDPLWHSIEDTYPITLLNIYYRNDAWKSSYLRTATGSLAYPTNPANSGVNAWMYDYGILPGHMFMFAQMEGKIWPYPDSPPPSTPTPATPSQLVVKSN